MARLRRQVLAALVVVCAALGAALQAGGPLEGLEQQSVDGRFVVRGDEAPPGDVVVVGLDEGSLTALRSSFPLPRRHHARVIDQLRRAGAGVIAYDVQFTTAGPSPADDERLLEALRRARPVLLATTGIARDGSTEVLGGGEALAYSGARPVAAQFPNDTGGVLRRMQADVRGLPTLAVAAADLSRGQAGAPDPPSARPWIAFAGPPGHVPTLRFSDVARGRFDPAAVRGKVVVVGATAAALQDTHLTPTARDELMSGPEVQANAVHTVLADYPLRSVPGWLAVVLAGLLAALPPALAGQGRVWVGVARGVGVLVAYGVVAVVLFDAGHVLPVAAPLLAGGAALAATASFGGLLSAFERQRVRDAFRRFVPPEVVDQALADPDGLRLGGAECEATVLFSDLRGFTTYSEGKEPQVVLGLLNVYLGAMTEELHRQGGTLICYMGDGIMAVFGAPLPQEDHAERALRAGRAMIARLDQLNQERPGDWPEEGLRMGVGINTGPVCAGRVGSDERLEYTVIGGTVNAAARMEGMTKQTGFAINLAGTTRDRIADPEAVHFIGCVELRGCREPVDLWGAIPNVEQRLPGVHPAVPVEERGRRAAEVPARRS